MNLNDFTNIQNQEVIDSITYSIIFAAIGFCNSACQKCMPLNFTDVYSLQVYIVALIVFVLTNFVRLYNESDSNHSDWKQYLLSSVKKSMTPFILFILLSSLPVYQLVHFITKFVYVDVMAKELNCCPTPIGVVIHTIVFYIFNIVIKTKLKA